MVSSYVYFKEIDSPSLLGYVAEYTIGLPGKVKKLFSGNNEEKLPFESEKGGIVRISKEDSDLIETFKERISVNVDSKTGVIGIYTEMPDPNAAAELAEVGVDLLQAHVINHKINKARENLQFIQERHEEAKTKFEKTQNNLAAFNDRNLNVVTARAQTEQQRLTNEYNLAFEVFKGLSTQLEQAEIKVKEDTPVFTVVEPIKLPVEKSKPKRVTIILIFTFLGIVVGILNVLALSMMRVYIHKNSSGELYA